MKITEKLTDKDKEGFLLIVEGMFLKEKAKGMFLKEKEAGKEISHDRMKNFMLSYSKAVKKIAKEMTGWSEKEYCFADDLIAILSHETCMSYPSFRHIICRLKEENEEFVEELRGRIQSIRDGKYKPRYEPRLRRAREKGFIKK